MTGGSISLHDVSEIKICRVDENQGTKWRQIEIYFKDDPYHVPFQVTLFGDLDVTLPNPGDISVKLRS